MVNENLIPILQSAELRYDIPSWKDLAAFVDVESSGGRDNNPRLEPHLHDMSLGVGQVLTSTAAWLFRGSVRDPDLVHEWEHRVSHVEDAGIRPIYSFLEDNQVSIELLAAYYEYQLNRYQGEVEDAVAAYNAGSVRVRSDGSYVNQGYVDKWLDARGQYSE